MKKCIMVPLYLPEETVDLLVRRFPVNSVARKAFLQKAILRALQENRGDDDGRL